MTTHYVILKPWEARAFAEGRKTLIARPVVPQPPSDSSLAAHTLTDSRGMYFRWGKWVEGRLIRTTDDIRCPFGSELLAGKEALRGDGQPGSKRIGIMRYACDGEMVIFDGMDQLWDYKRPALPAPQMPAWAVRFHWKVRPRVKRAKELSLAEGVAWGICIRDTENGHIFEIGTEGYLYPQDAFKAQWDTDFPLYPWESNPFLWLGELEAQ